jgi:hypothetical protein
MTSLLQSSRDQFCNFHVGLQDEIYDGWDKRFYRTTSDELPGLGSICTAPLVRNPTCGAQDLERSIDVSLSADLDGLPPGHNQSVDVSYFAQTPDGQRRNRNTNRYAIAKRSVFISTC